MPGCSQRTIGLSTGSQSARAAMACSVYGNRRVIIIGLPAGYQARKKPRLSAVASASRAAGCDTSPMAGTSQRRSARGAMMASVPSARRALVTSTALRLFDGRPATTSRSPVSNRSGVTPDRTSAAGLVQPSTRQVSTSPASVSTSRNIAICGFCQTTLVKIPSTSTVSSENSARE